MKDGKFSTSTLCPFYKYETKEKIHCYGITDENSIHMAFSSPDRKKEYKSRYCRNNWEQCAIAKIRRTDED